MILSVTMPHSHLQPWYKDISILFEISCQMGGQVISPLNHLQGGSRRALQHFHRKHWRRRVNLYISGLRVLHNLAVDKVVEIGKHHSHQNLRWNYQPPKRGAVHGAEWFGERKSGETAPLKFLLSRFHQVGFTQDSFSGHWEDGD